MFKSHPTAQVFVKSEPGVPVSGFTIKTEPGEPVPGVVVKTEPFDSVVVKPDPDGPSRRVRHFDESLRPSAVGLSSIPKATLQASYGRNLSFAQRKRRGLGQGVPKSRRGPGHSRQKRFKDTKRRRGSPIRKRKSNPKWISSSWSAMNAVEQTTPAIKVEDTVKVEKIEPEPEPEQDDDCVIIDVKPLISSGPVVLDGGPSSSWLLEEQAEEARVPDGTEFEATPGDSQAPLGEMLSMLSESDEAETQPVSVEGHADEEEVIILEF